MQSPAQHCQKQLQVAAQLVQRKQYAEALAWIQKLRHCEGMPVYWHLLSEILLGNRRFIEARNAIRKGLKLDPNSLTGKLALAQCELKLEHETAARRLLEEILAVKPDNWHARHQLITALTRLGDMQTAKTAITEGLEYFPSDSGLLFQAALLKMFDLPALDAGNLQQLVKQSKDPKDRFTLLFTLSRVQARDQDYQQAAESLKAANRLKRQTLRRQTPRLVDSSIEVILDFTRERIEPILGQGHPSDSPIFIVGMPRSGTTLTEQILNRHPRVTGVGERNVIGTLVGQSIRSLPAGGSVMEKLARKQGLWKTMGEEYLKFTQRLIGTTPHSADKMPLNANMVGFIRLIFPRAKIIHCKRDPFDTLLSCMQAHFNEERLMFSPEEWGEVYASYEALMQHWDHVFPGDIIHLQYEQLVQNPEQEIPALLDKLELPFHPDCLHPERSDATIRTASVEQVRNPINASSVGRSRAWLPWLGEVEQSLEQARKQLAEALQSSDTTAG